MTKQEQASQLRLAADILETGHPWEVKFPSSPEWDKTPKANPAVQVVNDCEIRIILATPPDGRALHNPDNLTADQVGVGYRLLSVSERNQKQSTGDEYWSVDDGKWSKIAYVSEAYSTCNTYRLPLSVPA